MHTELEDEEDRDRAIQGVFDALYNAKEVLGMTDTCTIITNWLFTANEKSS